MNEIKQYVLDRIKEKSELFISVSDQIWEYAELSLMEYRSAALYEKTLAELGFEVESGIAGMETAFLGKYGKGKPVIGILGEYDALTGLSQIGGARERKARPECSTGHGCGHNLLGAGALAAAYGIKEYLSKTGREGTVIFFGTPGEEGGAGKAFMAKEKLWEALDCALTWHPSDCNQVVTGTCNSCIQTLYRFRGTASHAAGNPELGRSALDAVELMNVGVQYLREHTKDDARIHYAIIDGGGFSPNVVQPTASVLYMVRSTLMADAAALQARVDKIAKGAALMTETAFEKVFIDGCSNTVPNHTIESVLYENFEAHGVPSYDEEEWSYANALKSTYGEECKSVSILAKNDPAEAERAAHLTDGGKRALNDYLCGLWKGDFFEAGSTDVGDVSWQTPAVQLNVVTFPSGCPGHSWQNVAIGKTSIAHKGMLTAGEVLAMSAVDLFENPAILAEARSEFQKRTANGYVCPIPDGEKPKIVDL